MWKLPARDRRSPLCHLSLWQSLLSNNDSYVGMSLCAPYQAFWNARGNGSDTDLEDATPSARVCLTHNCPRTFWHLSLRPADPHTLLRLRVGLGLPDLAFPSIAAPSATRVDRAHSTRE